MAYEGNWPIIWQDPNLDEASLREIRHFRKLNEYLYKQRGFYYNLSSGRSVNTEEYTIVYVNTIAGETYKVTDTTIERLN